MRGAGGVVTAAVGLVIRGAVAVVVASGIMPLSDGNFELLRGVTGAEALEIVGRLEALARP